MQSGQQVRMISLFIVAFLFFARVNRADETCEDSTLIQMTRSTGPAWTTPRDLATVSPSPVMKLNNMELQIVSAIPTFGPQNYIALIHQNKNQPESSSLPELQLFCSGPNGSHRVKVRVICSREFYTTLLCDWPKEEAWIGEYEVFLEDANGKSIGQVKAKYQPSLLKQYGTMACVRNLWNNPASNVSGLGDFPQWLDYHRMLGVEHFIIYTTNDMSPTLREVYQPYIDEGVVTRVHLDMPADDCWFSHQQQLLVENDCLYRAKGHAKWLMPSWDVDEYVRIKSRPGENITSFLDSFGEAKMIRFEKFRFARALTGLEISSPLYFHEVDGRVPKYMAKVFCSHGVATHNLQCSCGQGEKVRLQTKVASVNHYRHPTLKEFNGGKIAKSRDDSLMEEVPKLEEAMKRRYGQEWQKFLDRVKTAPELGQSNCSEHMSHGPPLWKKGQIFKHLR